MTTSAVHPGPGKSLLVQVAVLVAAVLAINSVIFGFGWAANTASTAPLDPPGIVVGAVWVALFAGFGWARWRLGRTAHEPAPRRARIALDVLIAVCWTYPFYAILPGSDLVAFIANIATIAVAAVTAAVMSSTDRTAGLAPAAVVAWVGFASVATAQGLGWF